MRRRFNQSEKVSLLLKSGGLCTDCKQPLNRGWHGDHVTPWSLGGSTVLDNGQALCSRCNLIKGNRMGFRPRDWQEKAAIAYTVKNQRDFLLVATPGAGKTKWALAIAKRLIEEGVIRRIVVVCNTSHLRKQWAKAASDMGLHLDDRWKASDGIEKDDYIGAVTTYQAVATGRAAEVLAEQCSRHSTLSILDEIHHAGDDKTWGAALQKAFFSATRRLALSGTPFRRGNSQIPFIRYDPDKDGRPASVADFSYGYGQAVHEGTCRDVAFPTFDGQIKWETEAGIVEAKFSDDIDEHDLSRRLWAALVQKNEYLRPLLAKSCEHLEALRRTEPKAGGLAVAIDTGHATDIAEILRGLTGEAPVIATYEEDNASAEIVKFRRGSSRWIVSVRMISEGIDIPRLRIGAYATNVVSELFFRQFVGRFVRTELGTDESYVYMPQDPRLVKFATAILEERRHYLEEIKKREGPTGGGQGDKGFIRPVSATGEQGPTIYLQDQYTPNDIFRATAICRDCRLQDSPVKVARAFRQWQSTDATAAVCDPPADEQTMRDKEAAVRKEIQGIMGKIIARETGRKPKAEDYKKLHRECGGPQFDDYGCNLAELERKRDYYKSRLRTS